MITDAFEGFAQSLRILLEAVHRSQELLFVDAHEAAGNIEQGFTTVLNAFHSIYDSAQDLPVTFDWYGTRETATLLAIRNARHHNLANRIRGLYTYHLQQPHPEDWKPYVIVSYPETDDGGSTFDVPISWYDIRTMLRMPKEQSKLRPSASEGIAEYLAAEQLDSYAAAYQVPEESVFLNATPLVVNAARKCVPILKPFVTARSTEAKLFVSHFESVFPADTKTHIVDKISVFLPS